MFDAGGDRYLLRHETADRAHYQSLHPPDMSFDHRMQCLYDLKRIGFQVGCGFMVGSPGQTVESWRRISNLSRPLPQAMCGHRPVYPA